MWTRRRFCSSPPHRLGGFTPRLDGIALPFRDWVHNPPGSNSRFDMYKALHGLGPCYLLAHLSPMASAWPTTSYQARLLCVAILREAQKSSARGRAFFAVAPTLRNQLPEEPAECHPHFHLGVNWKHYSLERPFSPILTECLTSCFVLLFLSFSFFLSFGRGELFLVLSVLNYLFLFKLIVDCILYWF